MVQPSFEMRVRGIRLPGSDADLASGSLLAERGEDGEQQHDSRSLCTAYIAKSPALSLSFGAGIIMVFAAICFTFWLSRQTFTCPEWAVDCHVVDSVAYIRNNITQVQSIVAILYTLGLSALAYSVCAFAETATWPLIKQQSFTLRELDTHLSACRGSVPSIPLAVCSIRTGETALVLTVLAFTILGNLASPALVGHVYNKVNETIILQSNYTPGGGVEGRFSQVNPPTSFVPLAAQFYSSWSIGISDEPMPEHRDWYIQRSSLSKRGNFTAHAVRLEKSITCQGYRLDQDSSADLTFETNMAVHNPRDHADNHSATVLLRDVAQFTTWVYDYEFISVNRTRATVVFAALNGKIDQGTWTNIQGSELVSGASAVACDIEVGFVNGILKVGDTQDLNTVFFDSNRLNAVETIHDDWPSPDKSLNEVLLWFAVAPVLCGTSRAGMQPTFFNASNQYYTSHLPIVDTSTNVIKQNNWTTAGIQHYINISIGAVTLATAQFYALNETLIHTQFIQAKLDRSRPFLLLILPLLGIASATALATWNSWAHRRYRVTPVRAAGLAEVAESSKIFEFRKMVDEDKQFAERRLKLAGGMSAAAGGLVPI
ncbi:hypothetical protein INS49_010910 [Diaporthe citri]|uniref:uncharacterized protein n=1 Tax=Diaporthe citri TaxID=83186 RepID=UPI001C80627C|nr:uncharacterized protein INS49_010910 [Diaporthe citri]KAG6359857.1 hypothetical protein INS49_010910 [Diaporthe citri]